MQPAGGPQVQVHFREIWSHQKLWKRDDRIQDTPGGPEEDKIVRNAGVSEDRDVGGSAEIEGEPTGL